MNLLGTPQMGHTQSKDLQNRTGKIHSLRHLTVRTSFEFRLRTTSYTKEVHSKAAVRHFAQFGVEQQQFVVQNG